MSVKAGPLFDGLVVETILLRTLGFLVVDKCILLLVRARALKSRLRFRFWVDGAILLFVGEVMLDK